MANKYYAVRKGVRTGIYRTWNECKEQVNGYSKAEFKSFGTLEEAQAYMREPSNLKKESKRSKQEKPNRDNSELFMPYKHEAVAYVDGSYDAHSKNFAFGVIMFYNGKEHTMTGCFYNTELSKMHNVAGEIKGAQAAMEFCIEHNIPKLHLYYDYNGIEMWATGKWQANKKGTIAYRDFCKKVFKKVNVIFHKVKGHSGDRYNDMADSLARNALKI